MSDFSELSDPMTEYLNVWKDAGVDLPVDPMKKAILKKMAGRQEPKSLQNLDEIRNWIGDCRLCRLCEGRTKLVFGVGNEHASLMFVGEGPGADEDASGIPFVGRAGQLLTKIIEAMGLKRDDVYIANVVKCRPPQNRAPQEDEIAQCLPFLKAQIDAINPKIVVGLGLYATSTLLGFSKPISSLRGKFHKVVWRPDILLMPTYHPAYLLRNPDAKKMVWSDMKLVMGQREAQ